jgi:dTDP-4-dehydrorhamnose reductase
MKKHYSKKEIDVWGGIECSYNRVNDTYMDQLELAGHYYRQDDIEKITALGIKALRYPVLWEKHAPQQNETVDWTFAQQQLSKIREQGVEPIIGLVHHGSGPKYADFYDGSFEEGLAGYASMVAAQFPWVNYYTPVNEPLTTARFCGLYGHWFPHGKSNYTFLKILLSECKATILAMQAIRKINPAAKLVQTEDLGKTHSTPRLKYQAEFENERRWLSFDLLCGKIDRQHKLWKYFISNGITEAELSFFNDNPCPPDVMGINHYITSERFLDDRIKNYPKKLVGGNGRHRYADVETVRVSEATLAGPANLLMDVWNRYQLRIAVTEVHLHCTREEQLRWFYHVYQGAIDAKSRGADILAVTAWAILGSFDWCSLLTKPAGVYEPGLFDVRSLQPRATALTKLVSKLANGEMYNHPVLEQCGWWNRDCRIIYGSNKEATSATPELMKNHTQKPLLIIGKTGTLAKAFSRICTLRGLHHVSVGREDVNVTDKADVERIIKQNNPWAVINTIGFVRVDDAEDDCDNCYLVNTIAPQFMADVCNNAGIQFITYSSDLVFDGKKKMPYHESDQVGPLNVYGKSKALAEEKVSSSFSDALIIRTSAFFGPWDEYNFVYYALNALQHKQEMEVASDLVISPTYVPDLVNTSLDLLIDEATGIWNISNKGEVSWYDLANEVARRTSYNKKYIKPKTASALNWKAPRPSYTVLTTERGFELPSLENALNRYFTEQEKITL